MSGIKSFGAYIPFHRLSRAEIARAWSSTARQGERSVASYDEDSITMAVAAAIDCLKGIDPKSVDGLLFATTTPPYVEKLGAAIIATALDMRRDIQTMDVTGTLRAGTTAMFSALNAVDSGSAKNMLVAIADCRLGAPAGDFEQAFGDGAAAFLIGEENIVLNIMGSYHISDDFSGVWRAYGDTFVRSWEDRMALDKGYSSQLVETIRFLMEKYDLNEPDIARFVYDAPVDARRHSQIARTLKLNSEKIQNPLLNTVGNTGTALAPMMLAAYLEEANPGDNIVFGSYGNGADAFWCQVTAEIETIGHRCGIGDHLNSKIELKNYEKYLRWRGLVPLEPPRRPEREPISISALYRERKYILGLYGFKCKSCGTPQYVPPSTTAVGDQLPARVCVVCQAKDQFEEYRFADKRAKVFSYTHDSLAASLDPPSTTAVVDFEGGGRGAFDMSDRDPDKVEVGMPVEMTFRKLYSDRGIHNYFWKVRPVRCQKGI
ncbi:OB-fold domain-containing protein [Chloroflexota bacterium]